ncbi:hypothetical protein ELI49_30255 (plasmid) [Rhizobium ruizarguesonis]|uniref:hypothetical protein n=1 Tax=Rhizobium ruizarguesonis TaxID=2081791 RepID=UPI00037F281D|nr:hypothetical protein [Rhizobium ruizarguesonis]TAT97608.1 hypothetical protein ELI49_30255 [Rhizobium ruizarguesonis]
MSGEPNNSTQDSEQGGPKGTDNTQRSAKYFEISRADTGELVAKVSRQAAGQPIPSDAIAFLQRLEFADSQVRDPKVVTDEKQRALYAVETLSYGQTGLQYGDVNAATEALKWFEQRVADQAGPEIRRRHLIETIKVALVVGVPALILALLIPHAKDCLPNNGGIEVTMLQAGLLMATGNALGIVFFAFFRNLDLKFDQLAKFDPAKLDPILRFTMVWIITVIFAILLVPGVLQIGLGGQLLNDYLQKPLMALIIGILCGYSDTTISNLLAGVFNRPESRGKTG